MSVRVYDMFVIFGFGIYMSTHIVKFTNMSATCLPVSYLFWSLISLELPLAHGIVKSYMAFLKDDSFTHTSCKRGWASRGKVLWVSVRIVLFVGNGGFWFQRFKKGWRAFATRAKAHRSDQNRQSPYCRAQRSNHWANTKNLTSKLLKQCNLYSWNAKRKNAFQELVLWAQLQLASSGAVLGDDGMAPDKDGTCLYCPYLSFCQEITRAYALVQQHKSKWCCGHLLPVKPFDLRWDE